MAGRGETAAHMDDAAAEDIWASDEGSEQFIKHLEHEVAACQSGQQSILDLVSMPLAMATAFPQHVITSSVRQTMQDQAPSKGLASKACGTSHAA